MTEADIWEMFAKAWDDAYEQNGNAYAKVAGVSCNGICNCILALLRCGDITLAEFATMRERLQPHRPSSNVFFFPTVIKFASRRAALCRKLAGECRS